MKTSIFTLLLAAVGLTALVFPVFAAPPQPGDPVIITPLGQKSGEFCRADRALIIQSPEGKRILYDPGRTVAGGSDGSLGPIDVKLLSGVHSDHIGVGKLNQNPDDPAAVCGSNPPLAETPNSNFAEIAVARGATVVVGGEMHTFLAAKIAAEGGRASAQILRHGGKRRFGDVTIAVVAAHHSNGVPREILDERTANDLEKDGLTAYVGPKNGYVLTFDGGQVLYLSGDTGHTSDIATIVKGYYGANIAVVNMGDIFSMGPEEAAFAVDHLIQPQSVIPSHANEEATENGVVKVGTRTDTFINLVSVPAYPPLSGIPMCFNSNGSKVDCP